MQKKRSSSDDNNLSATQHDALRLLASGCTAKYTALVLKLDYAMVRKWLKNPQFQIELAAQIERQGAQSADVTGKAGQKETRDHEKRRADTVV